MIRAISIGAIFLQALLVGCSGEFPASSARHRAAANAYDPVQLKRSLARIEAWHSKQGTGLDKSLRKGIPASTIEAALEGKGCFATDELKILWSWRNGEDSPAPFVWYHDFLSMEEALSQYGWLRHIPFLRWDPNYIPVFSFEGEWYAAYCGAKGGASGPIAHFFLEDDARITHINLTVFLSSMAEALESGAVTWKNGAMVDEIRQVYRIHQKHNTGYEFPYAVPSGR